MTSHHSAHWTHPHAYQQLIVAEPPAGWYLARKKGRPQLPAPALSNLTTATPSK